MMDRPLLLVGCGKMGGAMLEGWLEMGLATEQIHIIASQGCDLMGEMIL